MGSKTPWFGACALLFMNPFVSAVAAPPTQQRVQELERARAAELAAQHAAQTRAAATRVAETRLASQRIEAAARLRNLEVATAEAVANVETLAKRQAEAASRLAQREADIAPLLPLVQRLGLYPAETLLALPLPPEQSVRGMLVLGGLSRRIEADAAIIRAEQAEVTALRTQLDAERARLAAAQAAQQAAAAALDSQIVAAREIRRAAEDAGAEAARRAAVDAARAESLRAIIAQIEAARRLAEARAREEAEAAERARRPAEADAARGRQAAIAQPPGPGPKGPLIAPVTGVVVRNYGDPGDGGPANGVTYLAPPGARVIAPCRGRVAFAAPFRSFGLLVIIDCGGGYHYVVSGFDRLDVQAGQAVQAAEPIGVMAAFEPGAANRPSLYVELRRDGTAVNPAAFLRGSPALMRERG